MGHSTGLSIYRYSMSVNGIGDLRIAVVGSHNTVTIGGPGTQNGVTVINVTNGVGVGRTGLPPQGGFTLEIRGNGNLIYLPADSEPRVSLSDQGEGNRVKYR